MTPKAILATVSVALALPLDAAPDRDAKSYPCAIEKINAAHAKKPGPTTLHTQEPWFAPANLKRTPPSRR